MRLPNRAGRHGGSGFVEVGDETLVGQEASRPAPTPPIVTAYAGGENPELVWHNELGGLTYRTGKHFIKWNPRHTGVDLDLEHARLDWLDGRHPAPRVVESGGDDDAQWLVTEALPGEHAVGDRWRARRSEAIAAIAEGLLAIHSVDIDDFPTEWLDASWVRASPASMEPRPAIDGPVLVHGDACAPNTLIDVDGRWTGNVDFGDLNIGDRWADLAIASLSLDWNFGQGHQGEFFAAYGVEPDPVRIRWYRELWHLES